MSAATFRCPKCAQVLQMGEKYQGAQVRCPKCRAVMIVPSAPPQADTLPPSPVRVEQSPSSPMPSNTSPLADAPPATTQCPFCVVEA